LMPSGGYIHASSLRHPGHGSEALAQLVAHPFELGRRRQTSARVLLSILDRAAPTVDASPRYPATVATTGHDADAPNVAC
jgi:hypothetical protein